MIIKRIDEADFGCEERMPGEPLMVLVTLLDEDGNEEQLEVSDDWLTMMGLDEGDEWPEDLTREAETMREKLDKQSKWLDNYLDAVEELDE